jgi:hypothetical protein
MKRIRAARIATAGAVALAALGAFGVSSASAQTVRPAYVACGSTNGMRGVCAYTSSPATIWRSNNTAWGTVNKGVELMIECWYPGGSDGYWDHVVMIGSDYVQGHVDDAYVSLGGLTPNKLNPPLPHCG